MVAGHRASAQEAGQRDMGRPVIAEDQRPPAAPRRNFLTPSACGVCGKASIHALCVLPQAALAGDAARFEPAMLALLPERLREAQRVFSSTGGLHAAGLFTAVGDLVAIREDVGRHNAVDKVVGWALLHGRLPLAGCVLLVSGRAAPGSACAAMDGIAIRAASASSPDHAVGRWRLAASAFAWVDTGDPMPAGTDTVVERERVQPGADGSAWITGPAPRGRHVRARGEDISAGRLLIPAGHRLRPADLAAAAAAGHVQLETARRPVAAIIPA